ncbi:hypothetical protein O9G_001770 [Rozella allomycis CSF55]|uniref:Uncharacterized protein n=1 Tax=Rozella allomycis (strain CSF55) TaxID=988480 RepID=A0A075ASW1_ROZAC|nr:hypothetical protein O9G_001770 [Rozella allomycis CSF55]|eukprot:EPZ33358.1 hypothetical protein O9G_001770 [Rozella allomycis CSF55]
MLEKNSIYVAAGPVSCLTNAHALEYSSFKKYDPILQRTLWVNSNAEFSFKSVDKVETSWEERKELIQCKIVDPLFKMSEKLDCLDAIQVLQDPFEPYLISSIVNIFEHSNSLIPLSFSSGKSQFKIPFLNQTIKFIWEQSILSCDVPIRVIQQLENCQFLDTSSLTFDDKIKVHDKMIIDCVSKEFMASLETFLEANKSQYTRDDYSETYEYLIHFIDKLNLT